MGPTSDTTTRVEAGAKGDKGTLRGREGDEKPLSCGGDTSCVILGSADFGAGVEGDEVEEAKVAVMSCKPLEEVLWTFSVVCC
jgi:hypothetical protein